MSIIANLHANFLAKSSYDAVAYEQAFERMWFQLTVSPGQFTKATIDSPVLTATKTRRKYQRRYWCEYAEIAWIMKHRYPYLRVETWASP